MLAVSSISSDESRCAGDGAGSRRLMGIGAICIAILMSGCHGFATRYGVRVDGSEIRSADIRSDAVAVARRIAKRYDLPPTGTPSSLATVTLDGEKVLLAQFGHLGRGVMIDDGSWSRIVLSVEVENDGSALYFHLMDLNNGSETDYTRMLRESLEHELETRYSNQVWIVYRGKAGAPFVAP